MKIQSLSIVVPGGCPNSCACCVSQLHADDNYSNQIEKNYQFEDLYRDDFHDALSFARDNGCNVMMLTGDGEPLMNIYYLRMITELNKTLDKPFRWIELQTSGVFLLKKSAENGGSINLRWLRNMIRVKTISLSLFNIFDSELNKAYSRPKSPKAVVDIDKTCSEIRKYDFTLRLSLNMVDYYNDIDPVDIFNRAKELGANQITFRVLYDSDTPVEFQSSKEKEISQWIKDHRANPDVIKKINEYIIKHGKKLERLPFGAYRYSVHGMSCVVDEDCMSTAEDNDVMKYLILRPDCHLYSKWDDAGSRLF
ncbi:radical SAM protein [Candidatus Gracilibacteria bacterium]|nr:radical SAM protein [Candidatus Gracilibacteria bacterium]